MKHYFYMALVAFAAALSLSSCNNDDPAQEGDSKDYVITQFANEPFLGETYVSDYDYDAANQFLINRYKAETTGACSSFRNGDFAARNLDWYVRDYAILVVHTAANKAKGRYASVGIVSSNPYINRAMITSGVVSDALQVGEAKVEGWRKIFPIFTTDGINEKGVCVNTNIVIHEDGVRKDYKPCKSEGYDDKTSFVSLPRFILDNCKSCEDAIEKCGKLHLAQAESGPLMSEDSHILVSDNDQTVVLEWYNDEMVVTKFPRSNNFRDKHKMPAIMTNFYNCIGTKHVDSNGAIDLEKLLAEHPYAMGVERYEILRAGWEKATTMQSAKDLIKQVNYSIYSNYDSKWYTENGMFCQLYNGNWYYPTCYPVTKDCYVKATSLLDAIHTMYVPGGYMDGTIEAFGSLDEQMRNLDNGIESEDNWYTALTSIFDIKNKELHVMPQEGWYNNKFYKFTVKGKR